MALRPAVAALPSVYRALTITVALADALSRACRIITVPCTPGASSRPTTVRIDTPPAGRMLAHTHRAFDGSRCSTTDRPTMLLGPDSATTGS
jgi:hypothetical protein